MISAYRNRTCRNTLTFDATSTQPHHLVDGDDVMAAGEISTWRSNENRSCGFHHLSPHIPLPEKGGRKPASKQMLRRRFFFALYALCVASESCAPQRSFFRCWPFHRSNQSCCCGLEDYPRNTAWRIFETLLLQGGWR